MSSGSIISAIRVIKKKRAELQNTSMKNIIEASTNRKVISFNKEKYSDILKEIVSISKIINKKYSRKPITRKIFEKYRGKPVNAFRNNEVGDFCEFLIVHTFKENKKKFKEIIEIKHLKKKGYPDLIIKTKKYKIYLEIKATSRPYKGSPRDFYYSPGSASDSKIDSDGLHLLLGFITKETKDGFLINGFKIADVSKIKVKLKPEFNTDNIGIYKKINLIYE